MLCGRCKRGYFRGSLQCEPCASSDGSNDRVRETFVIGSLIVLLVVAATALYLWRSGRDLVSPAWLTCVARCSNTKWVWPIRLSSLLYARLITCGNVFRILLGYCQCLSVLPRLDRVRWPSAFLAFIRNLDHLTLQLFELLPAECVLDRRFGYGIKLAASLCLPLTGKGRRLAVPTLTSGP